MTSGDGIYSRYITYYPAPGRYSFTVSATDNDDKAYTIQMGRGGRSMPTKPPKPNFSVCCGSNIHVPRDLRSTPPTGRFTRKAINTPTIHLLNVPSFLNEDKMPPSKIGDLRINVLSDQSELEAHWTAPGGNFDSGYVSGYNFVYSNLISEILPLLSNNDPTSLKVLHKLQRRDSAGTVTSHRFTFMDYDQTFFIGMYAYDQSGNEGRLSNIVQVKMPKPFGPNPSPGPTDPTSTTNWLTVGIIAASVVGVLFILLIVLYVYFFCIRRKQLKEGKNLTKSKSSGVNVDIQQASVPNSAGSDRTDASSYDDAKNSSSNQLVPNISTITETYNQHNMNGNKGPRSFGNGITPTYWSASQLLKEHEDRKRREAEELAAEDMKLSNAQQLTEETNMGYDYGGEPMFQPYGYYGNGMMQQGMGEVNNSAHPTQYDLYYGQPNSQVGYPYDGQQMNNSLDHMTGYPINYPPVIPYPMNAEYNSGHQHLINSTEPYHINEGVGPDVGHENVNNFQDASNRYLTDNSNSGTSRDPSNSPKTVQTILNGSDAPKTSIPKQSNVSDNSSSGTLGAVNPSLQGSLLSVDGRPPSTMSKTRNITQV